MPAAASPYTSVAGPEARPVEYVVIHLTTNPSPVTVDIFQDPDRGGSAHYLVRAADGHVAQCVREADVARTARALGRRRCSRPVVARRRGLPWIPDVLFGPSPAGRLDLHVGVNP
ncbi:N-acetylmuramoyl-L-alanine amidase [Streptomyces avermitilis]|uniref:N-acetylmuramoyl-L-alanine amidase n=1 Tax=Streptomyces avermitilis TaxID=33903 RepID=UPI0037201441